MSIAPGRNSDVITVTVTVIRAAFVNVEMVTKRSFG